MNKKEIQTVVLPSRFCKALTDMRKPPVIKAIVVTNGAFHSVTVSDYASLRSQIKGFNGRVYVFEDEEYTDTFALIHKNDGK